MRNFGNDFFATQRYLPHHQFSSPSAHPLTEPLSGSQTTAKMEPHLMAKSVGVGTNLRHSGKTHFSPVNIVATSPHHFPSHPNNTNGHHNSNNNNCSNGSNNNNNRNNIPINLSQGQTGTSATTSVISQISETTAPQAPILSHLPTMALAAACPTIRGPSPAHHQQSPINGLPYHHSSHSPTLPVAHTALPSEIQSNSSGMISSNRSSPLSLPPPHVTSATSNSPYLHSQFQISNFNQIQNLSGSNSNGACTEISQNNQNSCIPNSPHPGSIPEMTQANNSSSHSDDSSSNNRNNSSSVADSTTSARIVSQNVNGTYAITGIPSNKAELEVFRVMQRANLLSYFDKMIENGGDDVQQLCDAGKEEFLEIMGLIGMAAKPLHVRRLQKALQEWMTQPSLFQSPVLPAGYQHHFGVSHVDRTISHTQFTATIASTTNSNGNVPSSAIGHYPSQTHHPVPVIPIPHLIPHNSILPYPAQNAPLYPLDSPKNSSTSTSSSDVSHKTENHTHINNSIVHSKNLKTHERRSNNSSPSLASNASATTTIVGLDKVYLQRGSPSIPVVISTAQAHNPGQQGLSSCSSSSFTEHYQSCPSPSGSTSSNSSTVSIKSHHQFHHLSSPLESYPDSPVNSESGRSISNKHEESSTCTELENASSCSSDQTNSIQLLDNSTGTGTLRVASRSSSYCGSVGGGSEPSSPAPPLIPPSFSKGILISSSQQTSDSPRSSTESITNRNNNSVTVTSTTSTQDFSSLQEHEIQKLAETAQNIVQLLPPHVKEPKLSKKIETSSYEFVRRLAEDDPRRMYEIRRLSAIFGKVGENGKRSKGSSYSSSSSSVSPLNKTMSILELAMNEAAAQLCKLIPALLTKKDEMYSLARQVIRDSGLPYNVICANSNLPSSFLASNYSDGGTTSGSSRGKIDDIRNSPAHEERISNEFAAACKKIKLDIQGTDGKETNGHSVSRKSTSGNTTEATLRTVEVHNPLRKSPPRENKSALAATLKRMTQGASEQRKQSSEFRRSQS